jgi:TetR/AcrR family transcriptional repressor of mexJK operon
MSEPVYDLEPPRKRGRPPCGTEHQRRHEMLAAAGNLFMEQGFEATSMEAVAKSAGISKKTIYGFVETKEKLFEAVMRDHMEHADLPELVPDVGGPAGVGPALETYLCRLAAAILGPHAVGFFRLTIAESPRFPEIAQTFFREGALRHIHQLGTWLALQVKNGVLELDDPPAAARLLTSFIILDPLRSAAMGLSELPPAATVATRVKMAVGIFLNGSLKR